MSLLGIAWRNIKQRAFTSGLTALSMSLVLAIAIFLYGTFYYAYMPVELVNMPVSANCVEVGFFFSNIR